MELPTEDFIPLSSNSDEANSVVLKPTVTLSDEQEHILDLAKQGKNIFFTGSAGEFRGPQVPLDHGPYLEKKRNWEVSPLEGNNQSLRGMCL